MKINALKIVLHSFFVSLEFLCLQRTLIKPCFSKFGNRSMLLLPAGLNSFKQGFIVFILWHDAKVWPFIRVFTQFHFGLYFERANNLAKTR